MKLFALILSELAGVGWKAWSLALLLVVELYFWLWN
jgi:hypothetical protein